MVVRSSLPSFQSSGPSIEEGGGPLPLPLTLTLLSLCLLSSALFSSLFFLWAAAMMAHSPPAITTTPPMMSPETAPVEAGVENPAERRFRPSKATAAAAEETEGEGVGLIGRGVGRAEVVGGGEREVSGEGVIVEVPLPPPGVRLGEVVLEGLEEKVGE